MKIKIIQNKKQIEAIKDFFARNKIPEEPFWLNRFTYIENPKLFVETHISMVESMDEKTAKPYIDRLRELSIMISHKNK